MPARWVLYSHDTLGLGHVRRQIAIARAVIARRANTELSALLLTCSPLADRLPMPPGLDYMKLPSAQKTGPGLYHPRTLGIEGERFRGLRSAVLRETCGRFAPHLMLVDKSPRGLMGELNDTLQTLPSACGTRMVVGWRDILDGPESTVAEWLREGTLEVLERHYDEIWVYGDAEVFDIRVQYRLPDRIAARVHHLGYLAPRATEAQRAEIRAALHMNGSRLAVVTVGGGEGGERVLEAWFQASQRGLLPEDLRAVVVTGPFMAGSARQRFTSHGNALTHVVGFVPGLEHLIAAADVVVGRAGYNTVCEVLGGATPAVLVPRVLHRDEQTVRAGRLADLGLVEVVDEPDLTPAALAAAVTRALAQPRRERAAVRLDGLTAAAHRILSQLPANTAAPCPDLLTIPTDTETELGGDSFDPLGMPDRAPARWAAGLLEFLHQRADRTVTAG